MDDETEQAETYQAWNAARLARDWHGGQWSPMYALLSSGTVVPGLASEFRYCAQNASSWEEAQELLAAAAWAEKQEPEEV